MQSEPQLQNLIVYTVFHIGVYVSLFTALISAGIFGSLDRWFVRVAVACFAFAGICGAVIGSNIPDYPDYKTFSTALLGPWGFQLLTYSQWATLEHGAFWLGCALIGIPFLLFGPKPFIKAKIQGAAE